MHACMHTYIYICIFNIIYLYISAISDAEESEDPGSDPWNPERCPRRWALCAECEPTGPGSFSTQRRQKSFDSFFSFFSVWFNV